MVVVRWKVDRELVSDHDLDCRLVTEWRDKIDDLEAMDDLIIESRIEADWEAVDDE